jgi:hypothetical protein
MMKAEAGATNPKVATPMERSPIETRIIEEEIVMTIRGIE